MKKEQAELAKMSYCFIIDKTFEGYTLRNYLESFHLSSSKINRLINEKKYHFNGSDLNSLKANDILDIDEDIFNEKPLKYKTTNLTLDVVYMDDYLLIVYKPSGLIIHSDDDTLITLDNLVVNYLIDKGMYPIPRHVNRLDKDTQGLVLYALDPLSLAKLSYDFSHKQVQKYYYAYCYQPFNHQKGLINKRIGKDRHINNKMCLSKTGLEAITKYEVLNNFANYSLVRIQLETGRTHQIRLHFASLKHPIIGDKIYGKELIPDDKFEDENLQLEAYKLVFIHPHNKKDLTIEVRSRLYLNGGSDRI